MTARKVIGLGAALLASACASAGKPAPSPNARAPLEILAEDAGTRVRVPLGETVRVRLRSVPTAGYVWRLAQPLPAFLAPAGEETLPTTPQQREPGFVGGEHWLVFAYQANAVGSAKLVFHEGRPWELEAGGAPESVFTVTIVVE